MDMRTYIKVFGGSVVIIDTIGNTTDIPNNQHLFNLNLRDVYY